MSRRAPLSTSSPSGRGAFFAFTGMVAFITGVSVYPRLTLSRDDQFTTLRYRHRRTVDVSKIPDDPGLIISSRPKGDVSSTKNGRPWRENDWILDTGATTHVCTNSKLMHSYTSFAHSSLMRSVGHFGPNPVAIEGMGECTLDLPAPRSGQGISGNDALGVGRGLVVKGRLTIHNVTYIPKAGINIISWSQLRRAKGLDLRLRDDEDGGLSVVSVRGGGRGNAEAVQIMKFMLRDGLYILDRGESE